MALKLLEDGVNYISKKISNKCPFELKCPKLHRVRGARPKHYRVDPMSQAADVGEVLLAWDDRYVHSMYIRKPATMAKKKTIISIMSFHNKKNYLVEKHVKFYLFIVSMYFITNLKGYKATLF